MEKLPAVMSSVSWFHTAEDEGSCPHGDAPCFSPCGGEDFNNVGCNISLLAVVPFFTQLSDPAAQSASACDHLHMKLCERPAATRKAVFGS